MAQPKAEGGGHPILNPYGAIISVSVITLRTLDMRGYLRMDRARGLKKFRPELISLFLELERTTYHRGLYSSLGPDFSGPNTTVCPCRECSGIASDLDHARLSRVRQGQEADSAVRAVKARRKAS